MIPVSRLTEAFGFFINPQIPFWIDENAFTWGVFVAFATSYAGILLLLSPQFVRENRPGRGAIAALSLLAGLSGALWMTDDPSRSQGMAVLGIFVGRIIEGLAFGLGLSFRRQFLRPLLLAGMIPILLVTLRPNSLAYEDAAVMSLASIGISTKGVVSFVRTSVRFADSRKATYQLGKGAKLLGLGCAMFVFFGLCFDPAIIEPSRSMIVRLAFPCAAVIAFLGAITFHRPSI